MSPARTVSANPLSLPVYFMDKYMKINAITTFKTLFEVPLLRRGASFMSNCLCVGVLEGVSDFLKYEAALSNCLYLTQFWTDFGQLLDSKYYDQA